MKDAGAYEMEKSWIFSKLGDIAAGEDLVLSDPKMLLNAKWFQLARKLGELKRSLKEARISNKPQKNILLNAKFLVERNLFDE